MRSHILTTTGVVATLLVAVSTLPATASSQTGHEPQRSQAIIRLHHHAVTRDGQLSHDKVRSEAHPLNPCYQNGPDGTGNGALSQYFTTQGNSAYSSEGADDFILSASCIIDAVTVWGSYGNANGSPVTFQVMFYYDNGGVPGGLIVNYPNLSGGTTGPPGPTTLSLPYSLTLPAGQRYWVSVQATVPNDADYWYWDTANVVGDPAVWENYGGGLGACLTWTPLLTCLGTYSDFAFELDPGPYIPPSGGSCYNQLNAGGQPINSQIAAPSADTDIAADDFKLTSACKVRSVDVTGQYLNSQAVTGATVTFYKQSTNGAYPATTAYASQTVPAASPFYIDSSGSLHIPLTPTIGLQPGIWWISVQVTVANNVPMDWGWKSRALNFSKAVYWNPGGGLRPPCSANWTTQQVCWRSNPDLGFRINKTI